MGGLSNGPIPDPHVLPAPKTWGRKVSVHISVNRLEVDENVNKATFRIQDKYAPIAAQQVQ